MLRAKQKFRRFYISFHGFRIIRKITEKEAPGRECTGQNRAILHYTLFVAKKL